MGKFVVKTVKLRFQKKVKTAETQWYQRFSMARWKGLEPLPYWFVASPSIQLSYQRKMERMTRLELATATLARWRSTRWATSANARHIIHIKKPIVKGFFFKNRKSFILYYVLFILFFNIKDFSFKAMIILIFFMQSILKL